MASRSPTQSAESTTPRSGSPAPTRPVPLPLCISFRWRGRHILCTPVYADDGVLVSLIYQCPKCWQPQRFRENALVGPRVGLCIEGCVRCLTAGCGLHLVIINGQARDLPGCI